MKQRMEAMKNIKDTPLSPSSKKKKILECGHTHGDDDKCGSSQNVENLRDGLGQREVQDSDAHSQGNKQQTAW